jgi:hypothetical protein
MQHRRLIQILFVSQLLLCTIGFAYVLAGGIHSEVIKVNPIADLYGWKSAGQKASELTQATKAQGIAVQNWTLGSRAAWYANRPRYLFWMSDEISLTYGLAIFLKGQIFFSSTGLECPFLHQLAAKTLLSDVNP